MIECDKCDKRVESIKEVNAILSNINGTYELCVECFSKYTKAKLIFNEKWVNKRD